MPGSDVRGMVTLGSLMSKIVSRRVERSSPVDQVRAGYGERQLPHEPRFQTVAIQGLFVYTIVVLLLLAREHRCYSNQAASIRLL